MWFKSDTLEVYFGKKYSEFAYNTECQFLVLPISGQKSGYFNTFSDRNGLNRVTEGKRGDPYRVRLLMSQIWLTGEYKLVNRRLLAFPNTKRLNIYHVCIGCYIDYFYYICHTNSVGTAER